MVFVRRRIAATNDLTPSVVLSYDPTLKHRDGSAIDRLTSMTGTLARLRHCLTCFITMQVRTPLNHRRTTDGPTDSRVLNIEAPSIAFHGDSPNEYSVPAKLVKVKVKKVRALDIAPLRVPSPQKRSAMARVLKGSHSCRH